MPTDVRLATGNDGAPRSTPGKIYRESDPREVMASSPL